MHARIFGTGGRLLLLLRPKTRPFLLTCALLAASCGCSCGPQEPSGTSGRHVFSQPQSLNAISATKQVGEACDDFPNGTSCQSGLCIHGAAGYATTSHFCSRVCDPTQQSMDCPALFVCLMTLPGDQTSYICVPPRTWKAQVASARTGTASDWPFPKGEP